MLGGRFIRSMNSDKTCPHLLRLLNMTGRRSPSYGYYRAEMIWPRRVRFLGANRGGWNASIEFDMTWNWISPWLEEAAKIAPLGTMLIAAGAAMLAWHSIQMQKGIARRRAALDFVI